MSVNFDEIKPIDENEDEQKEFIGPQEDKPQDDGGPKWALGDEYNADEPDPDTGEPPVKVELFKKFKVLGEEDEPKATVTYYRAFKYHSAE